MLQPALESKGAISVRKLGRRFPSPESARDAGATELHKRPKMHNNAGPTPLAQKAVARFRGWMDGTAWFSPFVVEILAGRGIRTESVGRGRMRMGLVE